MLTLLTGEEVFYMMAVGETLVRSLAADCWCCRQLPICALTMVGQLGQGLLLEQVLSQYLLPTHIP